MSRICDICGKGVTAGRMFARRGRAKRLGGVGIKTTGVTNRTFAPNLQRVKALVDGTVKTIRVCTRCIKSGKVQRPPA